MLNANLLMVVPVIHQPIDHYYQNDKNDKGYYPLLSFFAHSH